MTSESVKVKLQLFKILLSRSKREVNTTSIKILSIFFGVTGVDKGAMGEVSY